MSIRKHFAKLILLPILAGPLAAFAAPDYQVEFAPAGFTGLKMNNRGEVVGESGRIAAVWSGGAVTTLPGLDSRSNAVGINDRGDIVGGAPAPGGTVAFVYSRGRMRFITLEPPYAEFSSYALAINNAGQVAGVGLAMGEKRQGFLQTRGETQLIDTFGGESGNAVSINSAGDVVGDATYPGRVPDQAHATLFRNGVLRDLGTLGGHFSSALDINDAGQIVGSSDTELVATDGTSFPVRHAFLYQRGTMKDLGTLGGKFSTATAINNAGVVVGAAGLPSPPFATAAFVYARGKMIDLNTRVRLPEGWRLGTAQDINDSGQILATASNPQGVDRTVLLTPRHKGRHGGRDDAGEEEEEEDD